jgi:hypothetical protein
VSDIALDTLARTAPGDANSEEAQVAIFERIVETIDMAPSEETRPVAWVAAHTRKDDSWELEDVGGSTQRVGQSDSVLMIRATKDSDGRVTSTKVKFAKLREDPEEQTPFVEYAIKDGKITTIDPKAKDDKPLTERIVNVLAFGGGAKTKSALSTALGRSAKDINEAITMLFEEKRIRGGEPVKTRSGTYPTFELRPRSSTFEELEVGGVDDSKSKPDSKPD